MIITQFSLRVGPDLDLDLEALVMRGINMEYRGGTSLIYKVTTSLILSSHRHTSYLTTSQIRQPQATATIFSSGKVNMVGSRSEVEARAASRKVGRTLEKLVAKYPAEVCKKKISRQQQQPALRVRDFQVRVIWASTQLPWDIRMQVSPLSSDSEAHSLIARISF